MKQVPLRDNTPAIMVGEKAAGLIKVTGRVSSQIALEVGTCGENPHSSDD